MDATATRMTADEYYAVTDVSDRKQLVDGEIVVNEPKAIHARLQGGLNLALMAWVEGGPDRGEALLPTDVRMDEHNVYGPDLMWFSAASLRAAFPNGLDAFPERVPDLVVEIRSGEPVALRRRRQKARLRDRRAAGAVAGRRRRRDHARLPPLLARLGNIRCRARAPPRRGAHLPELPGFALAVDELFERA